MHASIKLKAFIYPSLCLSVTRTKELYLASYSRRPVSLLGRKNLEVSAGGFRTQSLRSIAESKTMLPLEPRRFSRISLLSRQGYVRYAGDFMLIKGQPQQTFFVVPEAGTVPSPILPPPQNTRR